MEYKCENCQYYRECPGHRKERFKSFQPGSLPCIAIHENPERGLKVANADLDELADMLEEKFRKEGLLN